MSVCKAPRPLKDYGPAWSNGHALAVPQHIPPILWLARWPKSPMAPTHVPLAHPPLSCHEIKCPNPAFDLLSAVRIQLFQLAQRCSQI